MAKLTPLKNGKFRISWYDGAGVRRRKYLPKQQAQTLFEQVTAQALFEKQGLINPLGIKAKNIRSMRFSELAARYRDEHLIPLTRAQSNVWYVNILIRKWGQYRLAQLNPNEFKNWIMHALRNSIETPKLKEWKQTKLAAGSIKKLIRYMGRVFSWGKQQGIVGENPFSNIIPKHDPIGKEIRRQSSTKHEVITVDEFWPMVETFPEHVKNPVIACFFSGIRRSELAALRWSKINRQERRFEFDAQELKEADSKNVYYDAELEPILERLFIDYFTAGYNDDEVFRNETGTALTKDSFTKSVRYHCDHYAEKTGRDKFRKVTPHTFRRSYCTRKDREGVDRKAVCANMGHHSEAMNAVYNICDDERQRTVAGNFSNYPERVRTLLDELASTARHEGIDLSAIQSELRQIWRGPTLGHFGPRGENDCFSESL